MQRHRRNKSSNINSWYIGSGNKMSFITRKPQIPFSQLRSIYGDEFKVIYPDRFKFKDQPNEVSELNRKLIKERVRKRLARKRKKLLLTFILTFVLTVLIVIGIIVYLQLLVENNFF